MNACRLHVIATLVIAGLGISTHAAADEAPLPRPLDAEAAVRLAVERSEGPRAADAMARAAVVLGDAESRLPDPEVMAEAWQVPIARPWAVADANMLSISVRQTLPAPGVLGARRAAREAESRAATAVGKDRARTVARDAGHAFVDLQSAEARRVSHLAHRDVAARLVTVARARLGTAAGRLTDVTQAEVERARLEADVAVEGAMVTRAVARLNGLLRRPTDAPVEPAPLGDAETIALPLEHVLALAEANRPELAGTRARRESEEAAHEAASREAKIPAVTVGAGWFAPTSLMPFHGYGVSVAATLPWVWGGARTRAEAARAQASAAGHELGEQRAQLRTEVASSMADAQAAAARVAVLATRAKPAADAALEATLSAYQSGQGDAMAVFRAEKDMVEIDVAIVEARTMLAHALVDVDAAAGTRVPRARLDLRALGGADHGHAGGAP